MNEQLTKIWQWMKSHLDRVVVGFVVVMFLLQVVLFMSDRSVRRPDPPELAPIRLQSEISPEHEKLVEVTYAGKTKPEQTEWIQNLIKFNMFDIKQVKTREDINREIAEKLREADRLYSQNDKAGALKVVDEILILDRNVTKAQDLKAKIQSELRLVPAPNP